MEIVTLTESTFLNAFQSLRSASNIDENSYVISCSKQGNFTSQGWVLVSVNSRKFYRPVVPFSCNVFSHTLVLTNTNLYNLNECGVSRTKRDVNQKVVLLDKSATFSSKFAHSMTIAAIEPYEKVETCVVDTCLKNYFETPRYLCREDLICLNVLQYAPQLVFSEFKYPPVLYFKVDTIEGPAYDVTNVTCGYLVDCKHTTVHQVLSTQCYLPTVTLECSASVSIDEIQAYLYPVVPNGFNEISLEIENTILPFLLVDADQLELSPIFLLTGKSGAGKITLLSSLAKKHGLHYVCENCVLIQNSNPAQTEKVIANIFARALTSSPCILHFRYIEALCQDESGNRDDRTLDFFTKQAKAIKSKYPIIIFCTTSSETKLSSLQRIFLQSLHISSTSHDVRLLLLNWILKKMSIHCDDIDEVARSTANFVFADLVQLVTRALSIHFEKFNMEDELLVSGMYYNLCSSDFSEAIHEMNAAYADSIGAPEVPNVTWDDVGGLTELKEEILSSLVTPITSNGLHRSGLLLHGPPGTGKTLLAKAVATECKYNFLSVKGPELLNMYVGQSEKNVREVFARARESSPCIVFFDELDSLAPKRGQSGGSGSVMDRVVSQLLAEMDGIQKSPGVFILAATNRPDLIDSALLRPGRLDKMLYVGSCNDVESKIKVLKALTRKFKLSANISFESLVKRLPESCSVTGADLYGICSEAWLNAARRVIKSAQNDGSTVDSAVIVTNDDLLSAFSKFKLEDLNSD